MHHVVAAASIRTSKVLHSNESNKVVLYSSLWGYHVVVLVYTFLLPKTSHSLGRDLNPSKCPRISIFISQRPLDIRDRQLQYHFLHQSAFFQEPISHLYHARS